MKFLYYSTAYYASHGGSIQSIEFYNSLSDLSVIKEKRIYPPKKPLKGKKNGFKTKLRSFLKSVPLLQIYFFYRKNNMYYEGLKKFILEFQPDTLMVQIDSNFLQLEKLKVDFPQLKIGAQVNSSPFDEPFKNIFLKKYFIRKQSLAYTLSDYNFFISEVLRNRIMKNALNTQRDIVVHNGTDSTKFFPLNNKSDLRSKLKYPQNRFLIGYIGTLDFHKKVELLLYSLKNLNENNIILVIIGDGPSLDSLKKKTEELNLRDNVIFRGWIEHNKINEHLNCFDIAIHHHANKYMSPLKIFEYLSAGLPVIAPNIPAVREILTNGEDVLLTDPTIESITEAIFRLFKDEEERGLFAKRGPEIIKEKFTWWHYTKSIVDYLDDSSPQ